MKKYVILSAALLFTTMAYAQKKEINSIKKILNKQNPTEAEYKEIQGLIDTTTPYIGNASVEEQAEFFYLKGMYEFQKFQKTNSNDALAQSVESFNRMKRAEEQGKKKTYTDKFNKETFILIKTAAVQKGIDFNNKKRFREATQVFKSIYDLDGDLLNLYYAASTAISVPDYNMALEYYQTLVDNNFTGEYTYYTAINKETKEVENFGVNKTLMVQSVKSGMYMTPKEEKEPSKRPEILKNMVFIYMQVNQKEKAQKLLVDARRENPNDLQLLFVEADFHYQNNDMQKYEKLMEEAIQKDPKNPDVYYNLGVMAEQNKDDNKAREYYNKTIQLDPNYVNAYLNLSNIELRGDEEIVNKMNAITGYTAADNKKYEELKKQREQVLLKAVPHLEKILKIEPNNESAIQSLIGIYGAMDNEAKVNEYKAKLK
ncbi:MAG: tetratricopeptide repeat protein [Bacteroidota bacterium]|nr:tetratricopeptide repeat protein [Bacteroidota bacterium]